MNLYYRDPPVTLLTGDAVQVLAGMPAASIDCVVTSPPYFGLRDYGEPGQYGLEATPEEYAGNIRAVFGQIGRVLATDGTVWLNLSDRYSGGTRGSYDTASGKASGRCLPAVRPRCALPGKNLLGIPWLVAFALQQDGWLLRNAIIWHKPNAMPESVRDRMACRHEITFLLARQPHHWFCQEALGEPPGTLQGPERVPSCPDHHAAAGRCGNPPRIHANSRNGNSGNDGTAGVCRGQQRGTAPAALCRGHAFRAGGQNSGDVWSIPTRPLRAAHFAAFPIDIPLRCIAAGCRTGGVVLDPFSGSGTTGLAAVRLGRRYTGIDINPRYHELAKKRLQQATAQSQQAARHR